MYMHVYTYIYIYIHTCIYIYIYVFIISCMIIIIIIIITHAQGGLAANKLSSAAERREAKMSAISHYYHSYHY